MVRMASEIACGSESTVRALRERSLPPVLFDGVEVGRVGRQVRQFCSRRFDEFSHSRDFVRPQVVHADDLARLLPQQAAQTFSDYELIVVDDSSDDDTESIVRRFPTAFPAFTYPRKKHAGVADSKNIGVYHAVGWSPDYLASVRAAGQQDEFR